MKTTHGQWVLTIYIAGDSIVSGLRPGLLSRKQKIKVKSFSGANVRNMYDNVKPILQHQPDGIHYFTRWQQRSSKPSTK